MKIAESMKRDWPPCTVAALKLKKTLNEQNVISFL